MFCFSYKGRHCFVFIMHPLSFDMEFTVDDGLEHGLLHALFTCFLASSCLLPAPFFLCCCCCCCCVFLSVSKTPSPGVNNVVNNSIKRKKRVTTKKGSVRQKGQKRQRREEKIDVHAACMRRPLPTVLRAVHRPSPALKLDQTRPLSLSPFLPLFFIDGRTPLLLVLSKMPFRCCLFALSFCFGHCACFAFFLRCPLLCCVVCSCPLFLNSAYTPPSLQQDPELQNGEAVSPGLSFCRNGDLPLLDGTLTRIIKEHQEKR